MGYRRDQSKKKKKTKRSGTTAKPKSKRKY